VALPATAAPAPAEARLLPLSFADLSGWPADDHAAALAAFRRGAAVLATDPPKARALGFDAAALVALLGAAGRLAGTPAAGAARDFFERHFTPVEVSPEGGAGFFTGYYEPVVRGSRRLSPEFPVPLYGVPDDLVEFDQ
jgi:membrane-bound lytic murein transglycosylase A